jgi:hypothetical protein
MNQEQLLDHVAELLKTEAEKGPGMLLLIHKDEFKVYHLTETIDPDAVVLGVFGVEVVKRGLAPSTWLGLAKKVWACKSQPSGAIKFPGQPGIPTGKPGRKPKPQDEPPKVG